jgi:hypothetical protein
MHPRCCQPKAIIAFMMASTYAETCSRGIIQLLSKHSVILDWYVILLPRVLQTQLRVPNQDSNLEVNLSVKKRR